MRVLLAVHRFPPYVGGSERVAAEIARAFVDAGHSVTVATEAHPGRSSSDGAGLNVVEFHADRGRLLEGERLRYRRLFAAEWDARIIYAAQSWQLDAVSDLVSRGGECFDVLAPVGLSKLGMSGTDGYFRELASSLRRFDCLLFHSAEYQDYRFAKLWADGPNGPRIEVIPNGADLRPCTPGTDGFDVVTISSHLRSKGHHHLYHLAQTTSWRTAVMAPASSRWLHRHACEWTCRVASRVLPRFSLLDGGPSGAVARALSQSRCFYLPSTVECSPLVVFEAMAMGTPWVSFDVGNVRELVGGIVVDSPNEAKRALGRILSDHQLATDLGERGRNAISETYNWPRIRSLYSELVSGAH